MKTETERKKPFAMPEPFVIWRRGKDAAELGEKLGAPPHCSSIELWAKVDEVPKITFVCHTTPSQWKALAEHFAANGVPE